MNKIFRILLNYLINGAIVILPLGTATFLMVWIFSKVDAALNLSGVLWVDQFGHPQYIPGLGIVGVLLPHSRADSAGKQPGPHHRANELRATAGTDEPASPGSHSNEFALP